MPSLKIRSTDAEKVRGWIAARNGVAVWNSCDLGNPSGQWLTPATAEDGTETSKPTWQAGNVPTVITSEKDVTVMAPREVRRFRVQVVRGSGLSLVLSEGASRRVRKAVEKAGEGSWYEFDYDNQEAVIFAPESELRLDQYKGS